MTKNDVSRLEQRLDDLRDRLDATDRDDAKFDRLWRKIEEVEQRIYDLTNARDSLVSTGEDGA